MIDSLPMLVYLAAAIVLTRIPYINGYLSLCYKLIQGVFRVLLGERKSKKTRLLKNESTLEITYETSFKHDLIDYVSYTATTLTTVGLFYLIATANNHLLLYIFMGLIAFSLVFWIRHPLEWIGALSVLAMLGLPVYFGFETIVSNLAMFLAASVLVQSVLSSLKICRQIFFNTKRNGIVAKVKRIPSMILALALVGQSLYVGYFIVSYFIFSIGFPLLEVNPIQNLWHNELLSKF